MNCVRSLLTAISFIVALCPSIGLAAEWIKITKPLPDVSVTLKVGDEFRVRSSLGTGDDKMYTIDIGGRVAAVRASDVELVGPERMAVLEKDWQTNRQAKPPKSERPSLDPKTQALIDKLKGEILELRRQQADMEKQLSKTRPTKREVVPGLIGGGPWGPGGSKTRPTNAIAIDVPNPVYVRLKERIQKAKASIAEKTKEITDLRDNPARRVAAVEAAKTADAERAAVLADLKKRCGNPTTVADRTVAILHTSEAILEAPKALGSEAIHPRKELLYKAMLLRMSTAAEDWDSVRRAQPSMDFFAVNYRFKFVTEAGLVRFNQGYVLLCKIDHVWWPIQVNVDGLDPYWQCYEHPLVTPTLWRKVVEDYKDSAPVSPLGN
jgi:hypothetical protein